ncbi:MAG: VOC family protein [Bryobacterales bacterium]|jgi:uncharacterized protein|nr:VOC family protein [Bryobacterales bacterium]
MKLDKHAPGTFCWVELGTTDTTAAEAFYRGLFGWDAQRHPMPQGGEYLMWKLEGAQAGGGYRLSPQQLEMHVPPHWLLYVCVEDAAAAVARVNELGGKVLMGPSPVGENGIIAVVQDPQGAYLGLWQPLGHSGSSVVNEPNAFCWAELAARDAVGARDFYGQLFGWGTKISQMGPVEYTEFQSGGQSAAGMVQMDAQWGDMPPHWMAYFQVADCDAAAAQAGALGAKIGVPPTDIPPVGRFAVVADPQGAHFSVIKLNE